ncbi:MAG TPA: hypothetical protein VH084_29355 [Mycobacterium sp.]|jgi:hypothetical protein|nr:hypothetical protein [Mycobacterium sp.]
MMTGNKTDLIRPPSGKQIAVGLTDAAWGELPEQCCGILLVLPDNRLPIFIPAPGRTLKDEFRAYLKLVASQD